MSSSTIVIVTLIGYKLLLVSIGFWASRHVHDEGDYFLAGQGLGAWTAGLSYAASTSSAWVLLGFTGLVYSQGVVGLWLIPGIFSGYLLTWLVIGPRLNADTSQKGYITVIDFIVGDVERKWARIIGIVCALMILFCFVFYISSQFQAAGNAFTSTFNMSATEAVLLGAAVIIVYCVFGGFLAASITDSIQAAVMVVACIMVPFVTVSAAGGVGAVIKTLHATQPQAYFSFTGGATGMVGVGLAMGLLGTGLGALGQPQLLNRIMAAKDTRARRQGALITVAWGVIIYSGLIFLAFAGRALGVNTGGESLFFKAAELYLPAVLAGIVIAAILSAVMSTVDSLLLAAASAVSHDMGFNYQSPKTALLAGRIAMVAIAVLAVLMTLFLAKDIFTRVLFAWVALGSAFGPTILTKCLGWNVRGAYVFAAIIAGFGIAVTAYNIGATTDVALIKSYAAITEKWVSWGVGLIVLMLGRKTSP